MSLDFFAEADCSHKSLTSRGQQSGCRIEAKHREVGGWGGGNTSVGPELSGSTGCRKGELVLKTFPLSSVEGGVVVLWQACLSRRKPRELEQQNSR